MKQHNDIVELPPILWVLLCLVLLTQAILIYKDAEWRGENKWFWGLFGLLNVPSSGLIYLFVTRRCWRWFRPKKRDE